MNRQSQDSFEQEVFLEEDSIDLRHYWRVLMRFKWDIIGLAFVVSIVTALVVVNMEDIYRSTASLMIESRQAQITSIEEIYGLDPQQSEYYSTQYEILRSRVLAERVIRDMDLLTHPEFRPEEDTGGFSLSDILPGFLTGNSANGTNAPVSEAVREQRLMASVLGRFSERLTVEPIRNTQLVRVHFESEDPELAATIANNLSEAYINQNLEQRLAVTQKASSFLSNRLEGLRETVEAAEQRLQDFLDQEQLVEIEGVTSLNVQQLDELNSQLVEATRERAEAEAIYRQVEPLKGRPVEELLSFPAILNHESIQPTLEVVDEIDQEIAELSKRYGRRHPNMIAVMSRKDTAQANLERQVRQVIGTVENQYLASVANEDATRARLSASRQELQDINRKSFTLQELERDVETNRQLYDMFFTRVRETDETNDFEAANALVVDPAVPAVEPSKPRRSLIVLISFAAALMLGIMLAFLRDMLDNTVKTPDDVENRLNATMLGLVAMQPMSRSEKKKNMALLGDVEKSDTSFIESIRTIRTGLTLSSLDNPYKLIEVTSSVPNEGKTTVALNLAAIMGQMGKTLLIDADLRRPSLARSINLPPNRPGVTNVLAGTATLKDAILHHDNLDIDMLTAGQLSTNPLELIASNKYKELLKKLSEHYDYVILDTPPTQAVSDALVMGSIADAVVYVVKAHATSINTVKHGLGRLKYANANVVGVVLNQVDTKKQSYYGGNEYYAGYYDSYGYSGKA